MWIRDYLLGITAAALICALIRALLPEGGAVGTAMKILIGIAMVFAVVQPWTSLSAAGVNGWTSDITWDANAIVEDAESSAREQVKQNIIAQTKAYILAKAESLGANLEISVDISDDTLPAPVGVTISGAVSPYAKEVIAQMITDDLGVNREAQIWSS